MEWYKKGSDGAKAAKREDKQREKSRDQPHRFWIPPEKTVAITFLDTEFFFFKEHNLHLNGNWRNWETSCLPGNKIFTDKGPKLIEDVVVGDIVLTHKGNYQEVTATHEYPTDKDSVTIQCGKMCVPMRVTHDHKVFYVKQPDTGSGRIERHRKFLDSAELVEGTADGVKAGDYMFVPAPKQTEQDGVITPDEAWLLAQYASDGSKEGGTTKDTGICISVSPHKKNVADKIVRILTEIGYSPMLVEQHNVFRVFCQSPDGAAISKRFKGMCGSRTFEKQLPDEIMFGSLDVADAALTGLVDGDGYVDEEYSSVSFTSTSFKLAMQCFHLALRLGKAPSWRYIDLRDGVRHPFYTIQWSVGGQQYNSHVVGDGMFVKVKSVDRIPYAGLVYDITVGEDHSFTIEGVAVRNCLADIPDADDCPLCEHTDLSYVSGYSYVAMLSIIDHSEFTSKRGALIKDTKKLIAMKGTVRDKMLKQKERKDGSLVGCTYEVTRYTAKENSTGTDFEFIKRCTPEELKEYAPADCKNADEWIAAYDYEKLFQPKSVEALREIIGIEAPIGAEDKATPPDGEGLKALL